jgi:methylmalonyl-CoA mutase cobalamin-binding domain/chain
VPGAIRRSAFCRAVGAASEVEAKARAKRAGEITYHMHVGLNDWAATERALRFVHEGLAERGHRVERYGLCLDRGMSLPEAERAGVRKETGPRLSGDEWLRAAEVVPVQPHLGDHMIGTPAGFESTVAALAAGITSIGNLGQYFAFDPPGGYDDVRTTEATVQALGAMAALRGQGALVHSYLDDGPAVQLAHYGSFVGWAALELYVVEELLGARLAHSFGGLIPVPAHRAIVSFALDDLRRGDSIGTMVYGNTVDYTADRVHNGAVLATYLLVDIAAQLHRPTGHAINPVPLSEAERIPSAEEILEVQLIAREIEAEARRGADVFDWPRLERLAAEVAEFAGAFRDRVLALLAADGVDITDAGQVLLALRRADPVALERRAGLRAPRDVAVLEPWKAGAMRRFTQQIVEASPALAGVRVVLAVLEVHDVVRDALAAALPQTGAEVILLPSDATPRHIAGAATQEDVDAIIVGSYNGGALTLARELIASLDGDWEGPIVFGGLLNDDLGGELPVDVRPQLRELGIVPLDDAAEIGPFLASVDRLRAPAGGDASQPPRR